jgi:hypothetical protein
MVHVNTMDTAQLCVHVLMTGPVVDVNVSFFYVFFMTSLQCLIFVYFIHYENTYHTVRAVPKA